MIKPAAKNVRTFLAVGASSGQTASVDGLLVKNVEVTGYAHGAIKIAGDIDPVYPGFWYLADQRGMTPDERAWLQTVIGALAADEQANPLTVAKAYQTFQEEGLIVVKRGVGMFVAEGATAKLRASERKDFLEHRWPAIAAQMRRLDLDVEQLVERALA